MILSLVILIAIMLFLTINGYLAECERQFIYCYKNHGPGCVCYTSKKTYKGPSRTPNDKEYLKLIEDISKHEEWWRNYCEQKGMRNETDKAEAIHRPLCNNA